MRSQGSRCHRRRPTGSLVASRARVVPGQVSAQTREILVVLGQQHGEHPVGRYEAGELPRLVHHGDARLAALDHPPGHQLLVGARAHNRRIAIHDFRDRLVCTGR